MTRKVCLSVLLAVSALALLLTSCGSTTPSIGVQKDVYMGMTQEELTAANGEPVGAWEEEDGTVLVGYDELTLYGIPFRADFTFKEDELIQAVYITDYVEPEQARTAYDAAYKDVAAAFSSQKGFSDEGTVGTIGEDERVYVYMNTDTFTTCVSYEYGMMTFTFMPKDIPAQ